jgi:D-lyxose ketol-isomerase
MRRQFVVSAQAEAFRLFRQAGIPLREDERAEIEVADFGLGDFECEGTCIATLIATKRYSAKALAFLPGQTLPEHWHPPVGDDPGKLETVRGVWGECLLVTEGAESLSRGRVPEGKESVYTCRNELLVGPGDQVTLPPGHKHWFQGGPEGAVVYSFSSTVRDLQDGFTDPRVVRKAVTPEESGG